LTKSKKWHEYQKIILNPQINMVILVWSSLWNAEFEKEFEENITILIIALSDSILLIIINIYQYCNIAKINICFSSLVRSSNFPWQHFHCYCFMFKITDSIKINISEYWYYDIIVWYINSHVARRFYILENGNYLLFLENNLSWNQRQSTIYT